MILGILCCQYGAEGKALAAMCIVGNRNQVGIRVIADSVDAWHLTTTDMVYTQELLVCRIFLPVLLAVDVLHNLM